MSTLKKNIIVAGSTILILITMLSMAFISGNSIQAPANSRDETRVTWYTFEEAVELTKNEPKKIFIDVYTDWCGWCKKMDASTFNNPTVAKYLNENFYPVKFNAEQKEDVQFKGYTFKYIPQGRRGYHQLAASLLNNQLSYPTVVFLDENVNMIQPLPGYRGAKSFYPILKFFAENHYKEITWQEFQKIYESPF